MILWDFATATDVLSWEPTHDLAPFQIGNGALRTRATGGDSYMHGPRIQIGASAARYLIITMRSMAGNEGQVFWITSSDGRWDETKSMHFHVQDDGHQERLDLTKTPISSILALM